MTRKTFSCDKHSLTFDVSKDNDEIFCTIPVNGKRVHPVWKRDRADNGFILSGLSTGTKVHEYWASV